MRVAGLDLLSVDFGMITLYVSLLGCRMLGSMDGIVSAVLEGEGACVWCVGVSAWVWVLFVELLQENWTAGFWINIPIEDGEDGTSWRFRISQYRHQGTSGSIHVCFSGRHFFLLMVVVSGGCSYVQYTDLSLVRYIRQFGGLIYVDDIDTDVFRKPVPRKPPSSKITP